MAKLNLEVGAFGDEVKNLHRKLISHGLAIPSSEVTRAFFGPRTRDAVLQWQRTYGLSATGIVDEQTDATLEAAPPSRGFEPQSSGPVAPPPAIHTADEGIFGREIRQTFAQAREAASKSATRNVIVNGTGVPVRYPFPSPTT